MNNSTALPAGKRFGADTLETFDAVVVGAGFAGLYMLHRLRKLGFSVRLYEAGSAVGGTWFWNRYPGARCDVESVEYSYSFSEELQKEWQWTERYASQPEILKYLNYVADRFELRADIQLNTRVTAASFDESANRWLITTDRGDQVSANFCVMATGCLSIPKVPDIEGLERFQGNKYHTANWPYENVDFTGQWVGIIGTGSSAVQSIPMIARQATYLFVFQRTPNFIVPAHNAALARTAVEDWKANHREYRERARTSLFGLTVEQGMKSALEVSPEERETEYEQRWRHGGLAMYAAFADIFINKDANDTAAEFVRSKIRAIVRNPAVAEKLLPTDYPFGTKRVCVDTGYYETFNRENVTLIDARSEPIDEITAAGVRTLAKEYNLDSIVLATGFDAITGALRNIDIRGRTGVPLKEKWSEGPRTYLGIMTSGFPNMFTITGPGSPSVFSNMVVSIEQHVDWIADCMAYVRETQFASIEATLDAENSWVNHVNELSGYTLFPLANSWYTGANVPGKPRIFMPYIGGVGPYRTKCDEVANNGYEGFAFCGKRAKSEAEVAAARASIKDYILGNSTQEQERLSSRQS
ncbi:MAG: NAD(P)/FAD-dependent oxidoreductase [Acidobacteriaceae bacterium]|nr:NAD(P)/FAD-dependent oxidoreductase [Acidobacteriaceae bacterium]